MKIISNQSDIKLGQFMQELNSVQTKIKNRKAAVWWNTPQKYVRPGHLMTFYSDTVMPYIIKT